MSFRTTFILMIVFLILGTFAIFDPLRRQEKAEQKKERESHVLWLKDKKLASITVAAKGSRGLFDRRCPLAQCREAVHAGAVGAHIA